MLQSETTSLPNTKTTKSEPKQSLIRADLKPCLACYHDLLAIQSKQLTLDFYKRKANCNS